MICLIPLTSQRASTTFAGVPCTDASHFDLLMIVNPGDWEVTNIISKAKQQGHRRCKYPKKHIIVDESTGDFAIVHGKVSSMAGFKRMRPTLDIVEFFLANGVEVPLPSANEVKDLAEIGKEVSSCDM